MFHGEHMSTATRHDKLQRLKLLKQKQAELLQLQAQEEQRNRIYFFNPLESSRRDFKYQDEIIEGFHAGKKICVWTAPNKVGKTVVGSVITPSWALGFEPWHRLPDGTLRPSSLGIKPPVRIRITGENWENHLGETIIPELKKWIPENMCRITKNNLGYESFFEFPNGSTFELMTYKQDISVFESWLGHGWWADEPPPRPIFTGMSRGLFYYGGKALLTMTPLKEAWIYDDLILSERPDVFNNSDTNLWDNPQIYDHDMKILKDCGLTEGEALEFMKKQITFTWGNADEPAPGLS